VEGGIGGHHGGLGAHLKALGGAHASGAAAAHFGKRRQGPVAKPRVPESGKNSTAVRPARWAAASSSCSSCGLPSLGKKSTVAFGGEPGAVVAKELFEGCVAVVEGVG
nr:hypothetical protein [Tanacetum cinerariifolium]